MNTNFSKNYNNLKRFMEFDLPYYNTEKPEDLSFKEKQKRLDLLMCLNKQDKNRFNKQNLLNMKNVIYSDLSILGKTQFDLYNSDINWNKLRNAVRIEIYSKKDRVVAPFLILKIL